ncbi:uncharacterized protein Dana_GF28083 [Drosophila ananassae]|uniref:Uncharacterized protein n=1 Tax=Drosophila ananassae TaxID=7217 RepID=A0A0N8NZQ8_DROAN|nr:uncharacterized protein Dana_GF28083 [Drosophila ananassae]
MVPQAQRSNLQEQPPRTRTTTAEAEAEAKGDGEASLEDEGVEWSGVERVIGTSII